ncbi:dephospho-CoA kinase domain-containing protein-like [Oppia nitens]|uniref:dephospho-CoA kinase domain-containing protein-like n=1 Tax=Oppia nitens TaxID=1686743 RepID=UPI0023D9F523|nr:dephospho-CoA kinase domain-containing protein-like [Oppia nitens]
MFIVGLTGGIGSGKSTVSNMLSEKGIDIIDGDLIARQVVRPGMKALKLLCKHFDLPLLFESGKMVRYLGHSIVVKCNRNQQIQRLKLRNNYTEDECISRIDAQMSLDEKCRLADIVIDNSVDLDYTRKQVDQVVKELRSSYKHWKLRIALMAAILITITIDFS